MLNCSKVLFKNVMVNIFVHKTLSFSHYFLKRILRRRTKNINVFKAFVICCQIAPQKNSPILILPCTIPISPYPGSWWSFSLWFFGKQNISLLTLYYFGLLVRLKVFPYIGIPHFIVLCFTALHRFCIFYKLKTLHQQKDYDLLYCNTPLLRCLNRTCITLEVCLYLWPPFFCRCLKSLLIYLLGC